MCKADEAASNYVESMGPGKQDAGGEVSYVKTRHKTHKAPKHPSGVNHRSGQSSFSSRSDGYPQPECKFCGLNHRMVKSQCPV